MGSIASHITSLATVYAIVYSDADQRKHQSSASLAFMRGIHRWPVNSPHKWPVTRKMFPFDDASCILKMRYFFYWNITWYVSTALYMCTMVNRHQATNRHRRWLWSGCHMTIVQPICHYWYSHTATKKKRPKWPTICRRHFQMHFLDNTSVYFDSNVTEVCFQCSHWVNTLRPRQMAAIFRTAFSDGFSWMKIYLFRLRFRWGVFPRVKSMIFQHWFR